MRGERVAGLRRRQWQGSDSAEKCSSGMLAVWRRSRGGAARGRLTSSPCPIAESCGAQQPSINQIVPGSRDAQMDFQSLVTQANIQALVVAQTKRLAASVNDVLKESIDSFDLSGPSSASTSKRPAVAAAAVVAAAPSVSTELPESEGATRTGQDAGRARILSTPLPGVVTGPALRVDGGSAAVARAPKPATIVYQHIPGSNAAAIASAVTVPLTDTSSRLAESASADSHARDAFMADLLEAGLEPSSMTEMDEAAPESGGPGQGRWTAAAAAHPPPPGSGVLEGALSSIAQAMSGDFKFAAGPAAGGSSARAEQQQRGVPRTGAAATSDPKSGGSRAPVEADAGSAAIAGGRGAAATSAGSVPAAAAATASEALSAAASAPPAVTSGGAGLGSVPGHLRRAGQQLLGPWGAQLSALANASAQLLLPDSLTAGLRGGVGAVAPAAAAAAAAASAAAGHAASRVGAGFAQLSSVGRLGGGASGGAHQQPEGVGGGGSGALVPPDPPPSRCWALARAVCPCAESAHTGCVILCEPVAGCWGASLAALTLGIVVFGGAAAMALTCCGGGRLVAAVRGAFAGVTARQAAVVILVALLLWAAWASGLLVILHWAGQHVWNVLHSWAAPPEVLLHEAAGLADAGAAVAGVMGAAQQQQPQQQVGGAAALDAVAAAAGAAARRLLRAALKP